MVNSYTVKFRLIGRRYARYEYDTIGVPGTTPYSAEQAAKRAFIALHIRAKIYKTVQQSTPCPGMATPVK